MAGFLGHLNLGHGEKPEKNEDRLQWVIRRCQHRVVPPEEIDALNEGREGVSGPPLINPSSGVPLKRPSKAVLHTTTSDKRQRLMITMSSSKNTSKNATRRQETWSVELEFTSLKSKLQLMCAVQILPLKALSESNKAIY